jgi:hypothetical protein
VSWTRQTARQVRNLLRRLHAAGNRGPGAPLVILDAWYSAAALTAALAGCPVHLLLRLPAGSVFYADPITWPGKRGRPGKHCMPLTCAGDPGQASSNLRSPSPWQAPRSTARSASMPGARSTP